LDEEGKGRQSRVADTASQPAISGDGAHAPVAGH
jgi:hypothetical protein